METIAQWSTGLRIALSEFGSGLAENLPSLIGAVLVLLIGWLAAILIRRATIRVGSGVDQMLTRYAGSSVAALTRLSPNALQVISNVAFWLTILIFIVAAAKVAELHVFSGWLDLAFAYLPNLIAGLFIIVAGYVVSAIARDVVSAGFSSLRSSQAHLAGRIAQTIILFTAVVMGTDQIGIDVSFLVTILSIVIGTMFFGLALAFGLGAQTLVGNLIGAHHLQKFCRPGQTLRLSDIEGEVMELTATSVILATDLGRVSVPAKTVHENMVTLLTPEQDDE